MGRHELRRRIRGPHEFANESELDVTDRTLVPPTAREEGHVPDEPVSDFDSEVHSHRPGGRPRSEITGGPEGGTPDETTDGLDPTEEAVRHEAEDHTVSTRREKL
jgi:hypothetical protein